jgi:hypothetical protein
MLTDHFGNTEYLPFGFAVVVVADILRRTLQLNRLR